jgi:hypothetical protein
MPWGKPQYRVGQDVYVLDPTLSDVQFRCRIVDLNLLTVHLWPDPNVEPDWASLPGEYQIPAGEVSLDELSPMPFPVRQVRGYAEVLKGLQGAAPEWVPLRVAVPPPPPAAAAAVPAPEAAPTVFAQGPQTPPVPEFKIGDLVEVVKTGSTFWDEHVGSRCRVTEVTQAGDLSAISVMHPNGHVYPGILASRFRAVTEEEQAAEAPAPPKKGRGRPKKGKATTESPPPAPEVRPFVPTDDSFDSAPEEVPAAVVSAPHCYVSTGPLQPQTHAEWVAEYAQKVEAINKILAGVGPKGAVPRKVFCELVAAWDAVKVCSPPPQPVDDVLAEIRAGVQSLLQGAGCRASGDIPF